MKVVKTITTVGLLCFALGVTAQTIIRPENQGKSPTFAIFTDEQTWQHCREELEAYRDVLGEEQLPTYIIYNNWQRPEEVKNLIRKLHRRNRLEGAVFVGDIPIPMIRKAQHLTSAFKMDETVDRRESSVPSDRFYDDLHLEFEPLGQDSLNPQFFYYNLDVHSPQHLRCDIYTGRIKPVADGTDPYEQISRYLRKAVHEHRTPNALDQFFSYTGHGSYSNSLTAWTMEPFTLREQMPGIFDRNGRARFMRFNMYNSIGLSIMPATGYSTGDAIRAVEEVAATALPVGFDIDYGSITREESQQGNTTVIIFAICILMIYLVLSGLYESYIIPFAVLLSVPVGLMGSFLFAKVLGLENNIYLQTGLIMLIGLISKTAILLTEYAVSRRQAGMGIIAAAVSAAKVRLRPILMTALTMIVGLLPLTVSTGVGANGNRALGSGVVGGMLVATLAMLFLVPTLFVVFEWLQEKVHPMQSEPSPDWQVQEEIEESEHEWFKE